VSPLEREHLLGLEPELRGSARREAYPPRRLSRPLVFLMGALRIYVVCCMLLVLVTFVKMLHH
jgi:hypothetical protein